MFSPELDAEATSTTPRRQGCHHVRAPHAAAVPAGTASNKLSACLAQQGRNNNQPGHNTQPWFQFCCAVTSNPHLHAAANCGHVVEES